MVLGPWTSLGLIAVLALACGSGDAAAPCFDGLDTGTTYRLTLGAPYRFSQGEPLFDPDLAPVRQLPSCGDLEGLSPGFASDLRLRAKTGGPGADGRACVVFEPRLVMPLTRLKLDPGDDAAIDAARAAAPPAESMVMKRSLAALDDGACQGHWTLRLRATQARAGRLPDPTLTPVEMVTSSVPPLLVERSFEARDRAACPSIAPGGSPAPPSGVTCADTWVGTLAARGRQAPTIAAGDGALSVTLETAERFEVAYLIVELTGTEGPIRRRWPGTAGNVVIAPNAPSQVLVEGAVGSGARAARLKAVAFNGSKIAETAEVVLPPPPRPAVIEIRARLARVAAP